MPATVLSIVQRHFPSVTQVKDATKPLQIEVTKQDGAGAKQRSHEECAMAHACKRAYKADGVILARSVAYLVKDKVAIRFGIPPSIAREITSFDRGGGFAPGTYVLRKPKQKLEVRKKEKGNGGNTGPSRGIRQFKHITTGIRTVLVSVATSSV